MNNHDYMEINEVAKLCGITVRTLHYYDEIGLLSPKSHTQSFYRLYSQDDLEKLQQILFLREIGFDLKQIKGIIAGGVDKTEFLKKHREILLVKQKQLDAQIKSIDRILDDTGCKSSSTGENDILSLQKKYFAEVLIRWKETDSYKEYISKNGKNKFLKSRELDDKASKIFSQMAQHISCSPSDEKIQNLIAKWQEYITCNYYNCSTEMLLCLGKMYVEDERFAGYFNKYGENMAELVNKAIIFYCKKE